MFKYKAKTLQCSGKSTSLGRNGQSWLSREIKGQLDKKRLRWDTYKPEKVIQAGIGSEDF